MDLLVVEDDPADAMLLGALLAEHPRPPFVPRFASSLAAARQSLVERHPDLLLVDLHLPDSSGWSTFEALATWADEVPIVLLSGLADEAVADRAVRHGAQNYLVKGEAGGRLLTRLLLHALERHRIQRDLKARTAALVESEVRFRTVAEELADGLVIINADDHVVFINRAARQMLPDLLNRPERVQWLMMQPPGAQLDLEGDRAVEVQSGPLRWQGQPAHSISLRDITERRHNARLQARVWQAQSKNRQLEEIGRLKSEMIAKVAHELRTPMTPLRSILQLLVDGGAGPLTEEQLLLLNTVLDNVERLSRFATQVLSAARLESGEPAPATQRTSCIPDVLMPTLELLRHGHPMAIIEMESAAPLQVGMDPDDLTQIVFNLISNAVAHNASGVRIALRIHLVEPGWCELRVVDDGRGIPTALHDLVFESFVQVDRQTGPGYRGTGLGLFICRVLAERTGGSLRIDPGITDGAAFCLRLPVRP